MYNIRIYIYECVYVCNATPLAPAHTRQPIHTNTYTHTHTHTYKYIPHTRTRTHTHTHRLTKICAWCTALSVSQHAHTRQPIHSNTHTHTHTHIHIHNHTHTHTHTHAHAHVYIHIHMHTHTYARTHTHTHLQRSVHDAHCAWREPTSQHQSTPAVRNIQGTEFVTFRGSNSWCLDEEFVMIEFVYNDSVSQQAPICPCSSKDLNDRICNTQRIEFVIFRVRDVYMKSSCTMVV